MLRSLQIGKLFGIPLYVHTTFFLLPAWLLMTNSGAGPLNALLLLTGLVGVFACVVLHELGHALMARFFGIGTESITLYPIGGVARLQRMSEKPFEEICIALAGPAVNLFLATVLMPLAFLEVLPGWGYEPTRPVCCGGRTSGSCCSTCCRASRWTAAACCGQPSRFGRASCAPRRSPSASGW